MATGNIVETQDEPTTDYADFIDWFSAARRQITVEFVKLKIHPQILASAEPSAEAPDARVKFR